jgi:hypothetical protein
MTHRQSIPDTGAIRGDVDATAIHSDACVGTNIKHGTLNIHTDQWESRAARLVPAAAARPANLQWNPPQCAPLTTVRNIGSH